MTPREHRYPGERCGLSEDEWVLEQLVDDIRAEGSLQGIFKLRQLLEYCNIETKEMTADWLTNYDKKKKKKI